MDNVITLQAAALTSSVANRSAAAPSPHRQPLSIFGLGYVGSVSMACFADRGHGVIGVDPDHRKTARIAQGESPIVEKDLNELLHDGVQEGRISVSASAAYAVLNSNISFVCVGTPSTPDGRCDLSYLKAVCNDIGTTLADKDGFHVIAFRSTVSPGACRKTLIPILEEASGKTVGVDFGVAFHPEFLREATAVDDFRNPPKTVVGATDLRTARMIGDLYAGIDDEPIFTSVEAAEMVKYVDNCWHATKVAFANEVGRLCKALNVDSHDVMDVFVQDTKLNLSAYYMKPGFAFGGSCLPKDVRGLARVSSDMGVEVPLLDSLIPSNKAHIDHAMGLVKKAGAKKVAMLGITFKPGTDDLRESPMLTLLDQLLASGIDVQVYDANVQCTGKLGHYLQHAKADDGQGARIEAVMEDLLHESASDALRGCDTVIMAHGTPDMKKAIARLPDRVTVIDLARVDRQKEARGSYKGLCW